VVPLVHSAISREDFGRPIDLSSNTSQRPSRVISDGLTGRCTALTDAMCQEPTLPTECLTDAEMSI